MTGTPWWYSGDDSEAGSSSERADGPSSGPRVGADWGSLLSGAQRIVDWATEAVMAPHAEHGDPRDHPDCMICRGMALLGEGGRVQPGSPPADADADEPVPRIEWIPIRPDRPAP